MLFSTLGRLGFGGPVILSLEIVGGWFYLCV
jgi:hypothetical protein